MALVDGHRSKLTPVKDVTCDQLTNRRTGEEICRETVTG